MIFAFMIELVGMLPKRFRTKAILNRFFITVNPPVLCQSAINTEPSATNTTCERLFSSVDSHMRLTIGFLCKTFIANITFERFLSGMYTVVASKISLRFENLFTNFAISHFKILLFLEIENA